MNLWDWIGVGLLVALVLGVILYNFLHQDDD